MKNWNVLLENINKSILNVQTIWFYEDKSVKTAFITILSNPGVTRMFFWFSELRGKPELKDFTQPQLCILLKKAAIVKYDTVLSLKSSGESTFAFVKTVSGLIGPRQLRKCARQPFPFSCLSLILLFGNESYFRVAPYPTSQLYPLFGSLGCLCFREAESEITEGWAG